MTPVPPPIDDLLRHTGWVRSLAARLAADPATADDLVQETWLAALRRPPRTAATGPGWLARVLRNSAAGFGRSEAHRRARQERAAAAEALPSVTDSLERAALQRRLVEAVWELKELYRTPILLRYFDGLPPREIARRMGLTPDAVSERLHRGLTELRRKLDADYGPEQARARLAALAMSGGIVVSAGIKWASAAAVLAVLGWWIWRSAPADGAAPAEFEAKLPPAALAPETGTPAPVVAAAEAERAGAPEAAAPDAAPAPPPSAASSRLRVRVLEEEAERPLPGCFFRVSWAPAEHEEWQMSTATTGDDGDFVLDFAEPVKIMSLWADPGPDVPLLSHWGEPAQLIQAGEERLLEFRVPRPGAIEGVVLDEHGQAVAGAEVLGWHGHHRSQVDYLPPHRRTTTDSAGRFILLGLRGEFQLAASARGQLPTKAYTGKMASGARVTGLELRVGPARKLRGRVRDGDGAPVPGVEIVTRSAYRVLDQLATGPGFEVVDAGAVRLRTYSDAEGNFTLDWPQRARTLLARRESHEDLTLEVEPGQEWIDVVYPQELPVAGMIVDSAGAPVAGATWNCLLRDRADTPSGRTEADGGFRFFARGADPEAVFLATAPGFAMHVQPVSLAPGMEPLRIVLAPAQVIAGRVLDAAGSPVADATLRLRGERLVRLPGMDGEQPCGTLESQLGRETARTDGAGRFRFDDLYAGRFRLTVQEAGRIDVSAAAECTAGTEDLVIHLGAGLEQRVILRGRVLDAGSGAPLPDFRLSLHRQDGAYVLGSEAAVAHARGEFELHGVDPQDFMGLSASAEGYSRWRWRRAAEDFPREFEVRLWPVATVELRVLDAAGAPRRWLPIEGTDENGTAIEFRTAMGSSTRVVCDENGRATLHDVPRCRVVLQVAGEEFELDLRQPPAGVLELRLAAAG